jgi:macrolide transport system ATP-binding/permease protein
VTLSEGLAVRDLVIDVEGVTRTYHVGDVDVEALRGVSLAVERGEFVAIVGSSGSGKSTLMAILGCLDRPTGGRYRFEGVDVATLTEPELAHIRSAGIGFVFQSFNLLPRTSALENVALPLFYAPTGPARRRDRTHRARAALARYGLADREANTPAQLSGGQQQRVAMARALINGPSLVLADEPTGNLDSRSSRDIMDALTALNRDGVTVVVVTHDPEVSAYANRIITLRDGLVVSDERRVPVTPAAAPERGAGPVGSRPALSDQDTAPGPSYAFGAMILGAAVHALRRNLLRSALTMLGVFIGVAALIAMVAVGEGANQAVRTRIESLGTNLLVILPGSSTASGVRAGFGSAPTLTVTDAQAIARDDPAIAQVAYLTRQAGQVQYGARNWSTLVEGVSASYPAITNWSLAGGRWLTQADDQNAALVALIGETVRRQLFGAFENPVGATILIKSVPMHVVGLLAAKGQTGFGEDQDDVVMIPFTTAERKVLGVATPSQTASAVSSVYVTPPNPFGLAPRLTGYVHSIYAQATTPETVDAGMQQVTATLARRHGIEPGAPDDFSVRNLSQIADVVQSSSRIMALLLATVASISLVVGGIGIMNILLVSVTERTREIGLRMAIGARRMHVLLQFLAEAVFISAVGGLAGILAGAAASRIISAVAGWPTSVPAAAVVGGFLFSAAVGVFFGFYPARKASRLDPMEALRYE